jgi:hypothetical protein
MQGLAFYAELLGFLFTVLGVPTALYSFLGALVQRELKPIGRVCVALGIWLVVFILRVQIVPGGEVRSSQYSGFAGLMQILFFVASAALLVSSVQTLRQQTRDPK